MSDETDNKHIEEAEYNEDPMEQDLNEEVIADQDIDEQLSPKKEYSQEEKMLAALNLLNIIAPDEHRQETAEWLQLVPSSSVPFPNRIIIDEQNNERLINDKIELYLCAFTFTCS